MKTKILSVFMLLIFIPCLAIAQEDLEDFLYVDPILEEPTLTILNKAENKCIPHIVAGEDDRNMTDRQKDCVYREFARGYINETSSEYDEKTIQEMRDCKEQSYGNAMIMDQCFKEIVINNVQELSMKCADIYRLKRYRRGRNEIENCAEWFLQLLDQRQAEFFEQNLIASEDPVKRILLGFAPVIIFGAMIIYLTRLILK